MFESIYNAVHYMSTFFLKSSTDLSFEDNTNINQSLLYVGQIIGNETLTTEFKEFRFRDLNISTKDATNIIINEQWHLVATYTMGNLKKYFDKYILKYLTCFGNSEIDFGEFYIGISDNGEVIGIPIESRDHIPIIRDMIYDKIKIFLESHKNAENIINGISVEIIELEYDETLIDNTYSIETQINMFNEKIKHYNEIDRKYCDEKKIWLENLFFAKRAINIFANLQKIRYELVQFVNSECNDDVLKKSLIDRFNNPEPFSYEFGEIPLKKTDINDPAYWLIRYRDQLCENIMIQKPVYHKLIKPVDPYVTIIRDYRSLLGKIGPVSPMIVIKIKFPGAKSIKMWEKMYYVDKLGKEKSPYRTIDSKGEPCCME